MLFQMIRKTTFQNNDFSNDSKKTTFQNNEFSNDSEKQLSKTCVFQKITKQIQTKHRFQDTIRHPEICLGGDFLGHKNVFRQILFSCTPGD